MRQRQQTSKKERIKRKGSLQFVATVTRGAEVALASELCRLGIEDVEHRRGAVAFWGALEDGYRVCLWSRISSRVLLVLETFPCPNAQALYDGVYEHDWNKHLGPDQSLAVDFVGVSDAIRHSGFGALKTKDAIVDRIRDKGRGRPSVDPKAADVRLHVYLNAGKATVSVDLSGRGLHNRGGGRRGGSAPLKENLAAAILEVAQWPERCDGPLVDPFCGSGTIALEAAGIALRKAPGLTRRSWGFSKWLGHNPTLWRSVVDHATAVWRKNAKQRIEVIASDRDLNSIQDAKRNARALGLEGKVRFSHKDMLDISSPRSQRNEIPFGLLIANPPYGERLGDSDALVRLYGDLGDVLRHRFLGWEGYVFTGNAKLAQRIGLKPTRRHILYNGPIECRLIQIGISTTPPTGRPRWRHDKQ